MSEKAPEAPAKKAAAPKKQPAKKASPPRPLRRQLGALIEVPDRGLVVRPDGTTSTVTGGGYVLDMPGRFVVDGTEVDVK